MTIEEASSIPLALGTAALGLGLPYSDKEPGGAGLKPFWEPGAKNYYNGKAIVVLGGSSSVGQNGERYSSCFIT
jgi:NADPH:quinone reductase-like Zn-dependent oxidoreductase